MRARVQRWSVGQSLSMAGLGTQVSSAECQVLATTTSPVEPGMMDYV